MFSSQPMVPTSRNCERRQKKLCSFRCVFKKNRCERRSCSSSYLLTKRTLRIIHRGFPLIKANRLYPQLITALLCLLNTAVSKDSSRQTSTQRRSRLRHRYRQVSSRSLGLISQLLMDSVILRIQRVLLPLRTAQQTTRAI